MSRIIRLKISQMTYLSLCVFLIWFSQPQYCRSFSANENESWHILSNGQLLCVSVARMLYQMAGYNNFFLCVRLTNTSNHSIAVELPISTTYDSHAQFNVIRPNQIEISEKAHRGVINERRVGPSPLNEARQKKLLQDFNDNKLTRIGVGQSIDYYILFNGSTREFIRRHEPEGKFLLISMDGQLFATDSSQYERIDCGWDFLNPEPKSKPASNTLVVIPLPIHWDEIPSGAMVIGEEGLIIAGASPLEQNVPATSVAIVNPEGLAFDKEGFLYLSDTGHHIIRRIDLHKNLISTVAGDRRLFYRTDNCPALSASLASPSGIAIDSAGNLLIADGHRIRKVNKETGIISTIAGNGDFHYRGDNLPARDVSIGRPRYITLDSEDNIYLADESEGHVYRIDAHSGIFNKFAGGGKSNPRVDGEPAINTGMYSPTGLAIHGRSLYVGEHIYPCVRRIDLDSKIISRVAGQWNGLNKDGVPALRAVLDDSTGFAFDRAGNLYICEQSAHRIRFVDMRTGNISTIAGDGNAGYQGDGGPALAARLKSPHSVILDVEENIYIADSGNNCIRKIDVHTKVITTIAGNGKDQ